MCSTEACNFIKKRLQHWCFPVKFAKFLRTYSFAEHFQWLLLFTLPYLHLLAYTYLDLLIYIKFSLYYYMNLIKLIKYGNIENAMKLSKLKSIFNIENNYLEAATGGVLFGDTF